MEAITVVSSGAVVPRFEGKLECPYRICQWVFKAQYTFAIGMEELERTTRKEGGFLCTGSKSEADRYSRA